MSDRAQQGEYGRGLVVTGWVIVLFGFLVLFFYPGARKVGSEHLFQLILAVLWVIGAVLIVTGYVMRRRSGGLR